MKATYYAIYEFNEISKTRGEIVDEGIIRDSEDRIYPQQNSGVEELPYECEACKFHAEGYKIEFIEFNVSLDYIKTNRINGRVLYS